ncbi:MAG: hypothetical protein AAGG38_00340 [Planctomycetota bacterium]
MFKRLARRLRALAEGHRPSLTLESLEERRLFSAVTGAAFFYNDSAFDDQNAAITVADNNALATDKAALGELDQADFTNYSSYSKGINGIAIDVASLGNRTPTLDDFTFRTADASGGGDPAEWDEAAGPIGFQIQRGAGANGSDRLFFTWDEASAVKNGWLQVTMRAGERTGLTGSKVMYFGSAVGDTGDTPGSTRVGVADMLKVRANGTVDADVTNPYDINRDGRVSAPDMLIIRSHLNNAQTEVRLIETPMNAPEVSVLQVDHDKLAVRWTDASDVEGSYEVAAVSESGSIDARQTFGAGSEIVILEGLSDASKYRVQVLAFSGASSAMTQVAALYSASGEENEPIILGHQVELTDNLSRGSTNKWSTQSVSSSIDDSQPGVIDGGIVAGSSPTGAISTALKARLSIKHEGGGKKRTHRNHPFTSSGAGYGPLAILMVDDSAAFKDTFTNYSGPSSGADDNEWLLLSEGKYTPGGGNTGFDWDDWTGKVTANPIIVDSLTVSDNQNSSNSVTVPDHEGPLLVEMARDGSGGFDFNLALSGASINANLIKWRVTSGSQVVAEGSGLNGSHSFATSGSEPTFNLQFGFDSDEDGQFNDSTLLSVGIEAFNPHKNFWAIGDSIDAGQISGPFSVLAGTTVSYSVFAADTDYFYPNGEELPPQYDRDDTFDFNWSGAGITHDGWFTAPNSPGEYEIRVDIDDKAVLPDGHIGNRDDAAVFRTATIEVTVQPYVEWSTGPGINTSDLSIEMDREYVLPQGTAQFTQVGQAVDIDNKTVQYSDGTITNSTANDTLNYRWEASAGTIDQNGLFTAPDEGGPVTITLVVDDEANTGNDRGSRDDTENRSTTFTVNVPKITKLELYNKNQLSNSVTQLPGEPTEVLFLNLNDESVLPTLGLFAQSRHTDHPSDTGFIEEYRWEVVGPEVDRNGGWISSVTPQTGRGIELSESGGLYNVRAGFDLDGNGTPDSGLVEAKAVVAPLDLDLEGLADEDEGDRNNAQLLTVASDDADGDGIPDWADLGSPNSAARLDVTLQLSEHIREAWESGTADLDQIEIVVSYEGPDQDEVNELFNLSDSSAFAALSTTPGVRLWRNNGSSASDYLAPGSTYTAQELGLTPGTTLDLLLDAQPGFVGPDGIIPISATATISGANHFNGGLTDLTHATTSSLDLDIDTNGDGVIDDADETGEDAYTGPGQFVLLNLNDDDRDLIPDYVDGFGAFDGDVPGDALASDRFTRLELNLPANLPDGHIRFEYAAYDVSSASYALSPQSLNALPAPSSYFRLWTLDGNQTSNPVSVASDVLGSFIPSGVDIPVDEARQIVQNGIYLEAVGIPQNLSEATIQVHYTPITGDTALTDAVSVLPVQLDNVAEAGALDLHTAAPVIGLNVTPVSVSHDGQQINGSFNTAGSVAVAGFDGDLSSFVSRMTLQLNNGEVVEVVLDNQGQFGPVSTTTTLQEGWNLVTAVAETPFGTGRTTLTFEIDAAYPDPDDPNAPATTQVSYGTIGPANATGPGLSHQQVLVLELLAPTDAPSTLLEALSLQIATTTGEQIDLGVARQGNRWLAENGGELIRLTQAIQPGGALALLGENPENADTVRALLDAGADTAKFAAGFVVGAAKGAVALVTDLGEVVGWIGENVTGYTFSVAVRWWYGEDQIFEGDMLGDRVIDFVTDYDRLKALGGQLADFFSTDLAVRGAILEELLSGDLGGAWEDAGHYRVALELAAELLLALGEAFQNATPYEQGQMAGRAVFEIVSTFVPIAGQVGKVTKATKLDFLTALANKPLFQSGKPLAALNATQASVGAIPSGLGRLGPTFGHLAGLPAHAGKGKTAVLLLAISRKADATGEELRDAFRAMQKLDYADAASSGDASKVMTFNQVKSARAADSTMSTALRKAGIINHHAIPRDQVVSRIKLPDGTLLSDHVSKDSVPALLIPDELHFDKDIYPNSFHSILNDPDFFPNSPPDLRYTPEEAKRRLTNAYVDWGARNGYTTEEINNITGILRTWIDDAVAQTGGTP